MKLVQYLKLSKHCVYALVCEENKRFAISYSDDLLNAIHMINKSLETLKYKEVKKDIDKIEIVVLEEGVQDNTDKKIACAKYVDEYIQKGYSQYYPSNFVRYTVHTDIISHKNMTYLVVYLKDRRHNKRIVGLFKNKDKMDAFINEYYPNNKFKNVYYADNIYTKNYLMNNINNWTI